MKNILRYIVLWAGILLCIPAWSRNKNIINYFASNNQIIGVPMLDEDNVFRFYPEPIFKNTIKTAKVNYFVTNDVITVTLEKRKDGEYWECTLRDFELGESIQRVEVMVEFRKYELDEILRQYQIEPIEGADDLQNYVLLRRGDDKMLVVKRMVQQRERLDELVLKLNNKNDSILFETRKIKELTDLLFHKIDPSKIKDSLIKANNLLKTNAKDFESIKSLANKEVNFLKYTFQMDSLFGKSKVSISKMVSDTANREMKAAISMIDSIWDLYNKQVQNNYVALGKKMDSISETNKKIENTINILDSSSDNSIMSKIKELDKLKLEYTNLLNSIHDLQKNIFTSYDLSNLSRSNETISIPSLVRGDGDKEYLYKAYQESRYSSILDIRYKEGDKGTVVFVYRNDKLSLQYLQAADPEEKLGIFRARLVPFPVFSKQGGDFQWQSAQVVYEIALNFGYGVIKGDHFTPRLFDMNRMGIGLAISNSTFGEDEKSRFLAVTLSYDINTYSTISFGLNVASSPSPYLGVGINARAFKDIFQASKKLFGNSK